MKLMLHYVIGCEHPEVGAVSHFATGSFDIEGTVRNLNNEDPHCCYDVAAGPFLTKRRALAVAHWEDYGGLDEPAPTFWRYWLDATERWVNVNPLRGISIAFLLNLLFWGIIILLFP